MFCWGGVLVLLEEEEVFLMVRALSGRCLGGVKGGGERGSVGGGGGGGGCVYGLTPGGNGQRWREGMPWVGVRSTMNV